MDELEKASNIELKSKKNAVAEKRDKQISPERKTSETKDSTSGVNNNKEDRKSKMCCVL